MTPASAARCLFLAAALAAPAALCLGAEPLRDCEVIAKVNGEVIQSCEIAWEADLMLNKRLAAVPEEFRRQAAAELESARKKLIGQLLMSRLDLVLFYSDFRRSVPDSNLQAIQQSLLPAWRSNEVPRLEKMLGVEGQAALRAELVKLGTSLEERQADFFRKSIASAWLRESVSFNQEVTHQQLLEYYHEHRDEFAFESRAKWEEIVVSYSKHPTRADAYRAAAVLGNRAHAIAAARRPAEPAFAELAKAESDGFTAAAGGQHGWTNRGAMAVEEIDDYLFTLAPGQLSPTIIEGPTGFHIVRVLERQEAGVKPFRDVQKDIGKKIREERFDAAVLERITDLKRGARIWTAYTGDVDTSRVAATEENTRR